MALASALLCMGSEQSEQYFDIDIGVGVESNRDVARDAHGSWLWGNKAMGNIFSRDS